MHTYELVVNTKDPGVGRQGVAAGRGDGPGRRQPRARRRATRARDAFAVVGVAAGEGGPLPAGQTRSSAVPGVPEAARERRVSMSTWAML